MPPVRDPKQARSWTPGDPAAPPAGGTPEDIRVALGRLEAFFRDRNSRPGVVARRLFGRPRKEDDTLVEQLIQERRRKTRLNGSMDGSLVKTAWTVWELLDLDCPPDHAGVVRTVGYVLSQQDKPGHFGEGCDPVRHEREVCRHFLQGFFSAGTADEDVAPLTFPSGVTLSDETHARFAASCFALRAVLRAGEDRRQTVIGKIESLLRLLPRPDAWGGDQSPDLQFFALGALGLAPISHRPRVEELVAGLVDRQQPDGAWSDVDLFHACEMLLSVASAAARDAVRRVAGLLCTMQLPSGAFDASEDEEKALIGAKVLRLAE